MATSQKEKTIEITCRILISLQLVIVIRGYISFLQTKHQLVPHLFLKALFMKSLILM